MSWSSKPCMPEVITDGITPAGDTETAPSVLSATESVHTSLVHALSTSSTSRSTDIMHGKAPSTLSATESIHASLVPTMSASTSRSTDIMYGKTPSTSTLPAVPMTTRSSITGGKLERHCLVPQ